MTTYFDQEESIATALGDQLPQTLLTIAQRFIAQNPALPYVYRAFSRAGFFNLEDGRYDLNLKDKLPQAKNGQKAYIFGQQWSDVEKDFGFLVSCYSPVTFHVNGELVYQPTVLEEVSLPMKRLVMVRLKKGFNTFLVKCTKTASGFGCRLGTHKPQWEPINIHSPFVERAGQSGWVYSEAIDQDIYADGSIPDRATSERATRLDWFPQTRWNTEQTPARRIFGAAEGCILAWSALRAERPGTHEITLSGTAQSPIDLWVDGVRHLAGFTGPIALTLPLGHGQHAVLVRCVATGAEDWGFRLTSTDGEFILPQPVRGSDSPWLYAGPFPRDLPIDSPAEWQTLQRLLPGSAGDTYWRIDAPDMWVRPFVENELYGRWTYPLGVTLYGILQTGRLTGRADLVDYVTRHVAMIATMHAVALWDKQTYGYPGINHQLAWMDALDDCGSFGSLMLEAQSGELDSAVHAVADTIADHMRNRQERQPDGAFYRHLPGTFAENTLWADDLYMCVPFLCRYYRLSGDRAYLDDAAAQFLLFKKYLFIPEYKILSHVYDFKHHAATEVPWGRGNGWALFSLSELLAVLPPDHPQFNALRAFYNELCEGYLALQGEQGLWHQVLTHPDAYAETSCTSMFTYAFARGIRLGWMDETLRGQALVAIERAWSGLTRIAVDKFGNVHGVCRGSLYSFTPEYYKEKLLWNLNDAHGTGIVMLAGIEVGKLRNMLAVAG